MSEITIKENESYEIFAKKVTELFLDEYGGHLCGDFILAIARGLSNSESISDSLEFARARNKVISELKKEIAQLKQLNESHEELRITQGKLIERSSL